MNNEETLSTLGPQYTERRLKQITHTTQYVLGHLWASKHK